MLFVHDDDTDDAGDSCVYGVSPASHPLCLSQQTQENDALRTRMGKLKKRQVGCCCWGLCRGQCAFAKPLVRLIPLPTSNPRPSLIVCVQEGYAATRVDNDRLKREVAAKDDELKRLRSRVTRLGERKDTMAAELEDKSRCGRACLAVVLLFV